MDNSVSDKRSDCKLCKDSYYVVLYNLFQFLAYFAITVRLLYKMMNNDGYQNAFDWVGVPMMVVQIGTFVEVMHCKLGLSTDRLSTAIALCLGRNFVLFALLLQEQRLQDEPMMCWLFIVWSLCELIRYLYNGLDCGNINLRIITWLRYTAWIVLYPLELLMEGALVMKSISYFEQSGTFTVPFPSNFTSLFYFPWFLYAYLSIMPIAAFYVMAHMFVRRIHMLRDGDGKQNTS